MDRPEPMVSMYEKTLTLTSASQRCEQLFIERLARLRTLGNYHGEVVVLDYGIDNRWNCSIKEVIKKNGGFYHTKNSDMLLQNGRWILDKKKRISVEKVVGLHLNLGLKKENERFSQLHRALFRCIIS